jgi:hypothetical protein
MISTAEFNPILELNLDPIKVKLMHKDSGEGWSLEYATAMEFEYRRFLYLMKMFPEEQTAPLFDVDIFWHYHILDTMKYAADCEQAFGYFLHHYPYLGLEGDAEADAEARGAERMSALYEATFGEAYIRDEAYGAGAAATAYCIRTDPPKAPQQGAGAAYCIRTDPPKAQVSGAGAAYCIRTDPPRTAVRGAGAAYCIRTDPPRVMASGIPIKGNKGMKAGARRGGVTFQAA